MTTDSKNDVKTKKHTVEKLNKFNPIQIPTNFKVLNIEENNFSSWLIKTNALIDSADNQHYFEETKGKFNEESTSIYENNSRKAFSFLIQIIDDSIYQYLDKDKDPIKSFNNIKNIFKIQDQESLVKIMTRIYTIQPKDGEPLIKFIQELTSCNQKLITKNKGLDDVEIKDILLDKLESHPIYGNTARNLLAEEKDLAFCKKRLLSDDRTISKITPLNDILTVTYNKKSNRTVKNKIFCFNCGSNKHSKKTCKNNRATPEQLEEFKKQFFKDKYNPNFKRNYYKNDRDKNEKDNKSTEKNLMILSINNKHVSDCIILDSGASIHCTGNKNLFITLDETNLIELETAGGKVT
jgi:gag-polypeptide of LTR copia-type